MITTLPRYPNIVERIYRMLRGPLGAARQMASPLGAGRASGVVATPGWWTGGGIILESDVAAVWQPLGAASLAASYLRIAGDTGNADLDPAVTGLGIAPNWSPMAGWQMPSGSMRWLSSGLTPGTAWSAIIRVSDILAGAPFGADSSTNRRFYLWSGFDATNLVYGGGGFVSVAKGTWAHGTNAIANRSGYLDGSPHGTTNAAYSAAPQWVPLIGAFTNTANGNPNTSFPYYGNFQALAVYRRELSAAEVLAVHTELYKLYYTRVNTTIDTQAGIVLVPQNYNAVTGAPCVIFHHGSGDTQLSLIADSDKGEVVRSLLAAGYIVAASNARANAWGNAASVVDYQSLWDYIDLNYNVTRVSAWGESMGGLSALTCMGQNDPPYKGFLGTYPACNLRWCYDNGLNSPINTAYGISGDYEAKTAGYDPALLSGALFTSKRLRFYASTSDVSISKVYNSDLFSALVDDYATEYAVIACSGTHGDASHFQPTDYVDFFNRCV